MKNIVVLLASLWAAAVTSGCGPQIVPSRTAPPSAAQAAADRARHGLEFRSISGQRSFVADPVRATARMRGNERFIEIQGRGFAWRLPRTLIAGASRVDGSTRTDVDVDLVAGPVVPDHGGIRAQQLPVGCSTTCNKETGTGVCDPSYQSCGPCPECSGPQPSPGDSVLCLNDPACGDDGFGNHVGIGLFFMDDSVTCEYDFATRDTNCSFSNANPRPSRPSNNIAISWLHSGAYVRLACDISKFAPLLPLTADAVYKDSTGQVYTWFRDDTGTNPDYWIAPDEAGKPVVPSPPAKVAIHATYE